MVKTRAGHACLSIEKLVLVSGGFASVYLNGKIDRIFPEELEAWSENGSWKLIPSLRKSIRYHNMILNNGDVYIIGGHDPGVYYEAKTYPSEIFKVDFKKGIVETEKETEILKERRFSAVSFVLPYGYLRSCEGMYF